MTQYRKTFKTQKCYRCGESTKLADGIVAYVYSTLCAVCLSEYHTEITCRECRRKFPLKKAAPPGRLETFVCESCEGELSRKKEGRAQNQALKKEQRRVGKLIRVWKRKKQAALEAAFVYENRRNKASYWRDLGNVKKEVCAVVDASGGVLPTHKELRDRGMTKLAEALSKFGREVIATATNLGGTYCCECGVSRYTTPTRKPLEMLGEYTCRSCVEFLKAQEKETVGYAKLRSIYNQIRARTAARNIPRDVTLSHLREMYRRQGGKCLLTGIPFVNEKLEGTDFAHPFSVSVDRIVPALGYCKDNIRLVTLMMNTALNAYGEEAFRELAIAYLQHNTTKRQSRYIQILKGRA